MAAVAFHSILKAQVFSRTCDDSSFYMLCCAIANVG